MKLAARTGFLLSHPLAWYAAAKAFSGGCFLLSCGGCPGSSSFEANNCSTASGLVLPAQCNSAVGNKSIEEACASAECLGLFCPLDDVGAAIPTPHPTLFILDFHEPSFAPPINPAPQPTAPPSLPPGNGANATDSGSRSGWNHGFTIGQRTAPPATDQTQLAVAWAILIPLLALFLVGVGIKTKQWVSEATSEFAFAVDRESGGAGRNQYETPRIADGDFDGEGGGGAEAEEAGVEWSRSASGRGSYHRSNLEVDSWSESKNPFSDPWAAAAPGRGLSVGSASGGGKAGSGLAYFARAAASAAASASSAAASAASSASSAGVRGVASRSRGGHVPLSTDDAEDAPLSDEAI